MVDLSVREPGTDESGLDGAFSMDCAWVFAAHRRPRVSLAKSCGSIPVTAGAQELWESSAQVGLGFSHPDLFCGNGFFLTKSKATGEGARPTQLLFVTS